MRQRCRHLVQRTACGVGVVVALVGFLAAQVGFPMTVRSASAGKMVRPCGCLVKDENEACCCTATKAPAAAACCHIKPVAEPVAPSCCHAKAVPHETKRDTAVRVAWVIGSLMQHCHGLQTCWITLGAVLPPADHVRVPVDSCQPERVQCAETVAYVRSAAPTDPPPKFPSV